MNWKNRRHKNQYADAFTNSFLHDYTFYPVCPIGSLTFQGILKLYYLVTSPHRMLIKMPVSIIWPQEWHALALWLSDWVRSHPRTGIIYGLDSFLRLSLRPKLDCVLNVGMSLHCGSALDVPHKQLVVLVLGECVAWLVEVGHWVCTFVGYGQLCFQPELSAPQSGVSALTSFSDGLWPGSYMMK